MAVVHPRYGNVTIGGMGGGATPRAVYVSNGTGANWASTNDQTTAHDKLKVEGKDADIFINGQSLSDWMQTVDRRLTILRPNLELQEKYEALQAAYDHYKTLESLLYEQE